MGTEYDVNANLRLGGIGQNRGALRSLGGSLTSIGATIRGNSSAAAGFVRQLAGVAAAYVGFRAIGGAMRGLVRESISFNAELESTRIGLASVISGVEGISFAEGLERGGRIFEQIREDAIHSTATTQEMFGIFQSIVGPIRAAGSSMDSVRTITQDTVTAASALGVDFGQAQRDIGMMVRGAAGMDTRMFSLMTSMGLITQSTEEWNQQMSAQERIAALTTALGSFSEAGDAYGRSWTGLTSSFRDITGQFIATLGAPVFERLKGAMAGFNTALLENRGRIEEILTATGTRIAIVLDRVFGRLQAGFQWVTTNWDTISARIAEIVSRVRAMVPQLVNAAKAYAAVEIGRFAVGTGVQVAGVGVQGAAALGGAVTAAGGGAAAAGGGGAAAGAAGGGGILAGIGSAVSAAFAPLALIFAGVASAGFVAVELWEDIQSAFLIIQPLLTGIWTDLGRLGSALWRIARPLIRLVGGQFLLIIGAGFMALIAALRVITFVVAEVAEGLAWLADQFNTYVVDPIVAGVGIMITTAASFLRALFLPTDYERRTQQRAGAGGGEQDPIAELERRYGQGEGGRAFTFATAGAGGGGTPLQRPVVHNDFRGSRISVRQEFRQADPDRIAIQMIEDLTRQAESRTQSQFAPALSR